MTMLELLHSPFTQGVFTASLVLAVGAVAAALVRRPTVRLRTIQWTLFGTLIVPLCAAFGVLPQWRLGWIAERKPAGVPIENVATQPVPTSFEFEVDSAARSEVTPPSMVMLETVPAERSAAESVATPSVASRAIEEPATVSTTSIPWTTLLIAGYFSVVAFLTLRIVVGLARCRRMLKRAVTATPLAQELLAEFVGTKRVRLLVSPEIDAPVTWGVFRPVILLPRSFCESTSADALRFGLAHEWSHVVRRDIVNLHMANAVRTLMWFHPASWWLPKQLELCQDYVADAAAAGEATEAEDYAEFLVALSRNRVCRELPGTLGIFGNTSRLSRRITMLVNKERSLLRRVSSLGNALIAVAAIGVGLGVAAVRLDAAPEEKPKAEQQKAKEPAKPKEGEPNKAERQANAEAKSITYDCQVTNRDTGKPIAGAKVQVKRQLSRDPKTNKWIDLNLTTHTTDEKGRYSFTLPPEQVKERSLYIVVKVQHRDYLSYGWGGYSHTMILKNIDAGERPFYEHIKLSPGKPISGTVLGPDRKPLAGVTVRTYSKPENTPRFRFGAWDDVKTDDKGRFEITVASPGEGVLWITPAKHVPQAHLVSKKHGDLGEFIVVEGPATNGRVLDAKGNPVAGVSVHARSDSDGEDVDRFLNQNAVARGLGRNATTDKDGRFKFAPLPAGSYSINVRKVERTGPPLEHVFVRSRFTIKREEQPEELVVRAEPHVVVRMKFLDSKGNLTTSHQNFIFGRLGGNSFFGQSTRATKDDGISEIKVPHGLERAQIDLMSNEHHVLRWRKKPEDKLSNKRRVDLGTIEEDITGIEVIRYTCPLLIVKAVDEDGKQVKNYKPKATYMRDSPKNPNSRFISGVNGDINFDHQQDGRWRSSNMYPDQSFTLTIEKEGYTAEPQLLTLKEGAKHEVTITVEKSK